MEITSSLERQINELKLSISHYEIEARNAQRKCDDIFCFKKKGYFLVSCI